MATHDYYLPEATIATLEAALKAVSSSDVESSLTLKKRLVGGLWHYEVTLITGDESPNPKEVG